MTEIADRNRLIELVIDKHTRFLEAFTGELSEIQSKLNAVKQQSDTVKKEMEKAQTRISVLNEKYHLLFYQAAKQREEMFIRVLESMPPADAKNIKRFGTRLEAIEKKLQSSRNIEEEENLIAEGEKLLHDFALAAGNAGRTVQCRGIIDLLQEANRSHRELLSIDNMPKQQAESARECDGQISDMEGRHTWLTHRIDSHRDALAYWEKQQGGK